MPAKVKKIKRDYPSWVPVLIGSPVELVSHRQMVNKYEVNREIKYWATWHLLKSFTTTGYIQEWVKQRDYLLPFLQMNENTFRSHLTWLQQKGLLDVEKKTRSIRLTSYEKAAKILDIPFYGTYHVHYQHDKIFYAPPPPQTDPRARKRKRVRKAAAKQSFQYFLRSEEIEDRKKRSLAAIMRKLDENPRLFTDLVFLLTQHGCDTNRLHSDPAYFQERLLQLQIRYFKEGSELLAYVFTLRADINRGVKKIRDHHQYKSATSVSYMKRRMFQMGIVEVRKITVVSESRSRIFIPDEEKGGQREGYKWLPAQKQTALVLCDQITARYATDIEEHMNGLTLKKIA